MKTIKHLIILAMLLITPMAMGENDEELAIAIATTKGAPVKRAPQIADIILHIESYGVIIEFNGDYGDGYAELSDMTTNDTTSRDIYAQDGDTEVLYLTMSPTSTYSLTITFDDGRYGHIVW